MRSWRAILSAGAVVTASFLAGCTGAVCTDFVVGSNVDALKSGESATLTAVFRNCATEHFVLEHPCAEPIDLEITDGTSVWYLRAGKAHANPVTCAEPPPWTKSIPPNKDRSRTEQWDGKLPEPGCTASCAYVPAPPGDYTVTAKAHTPEGQTFEAKTTLTVQG